MLPQVNAELLFIGSGSPSEDWDAPAGATVTTKWSGSSDAYLMEKTRSTFAGGGGAYATTKDVTIIIPSTLVDTSGNDLDIEPEDTITYNFMGITHSRKVMDITSSFLPGLGMQEYIRLHLRPEAAEIALESE